MIVEDGICYGVVIFIGVSYWVKVVVIIVGIVFCGEIIIGELKYLLGLNNF